MKLKILSGTLILSILTGSLTYYFSNKKFNKELSEIKNKYEETIDKLNIEKEEREQEIDKIIENNNEIVEDLNKQIDNYKNQIDKMKILTSTISYYTNCPEENSGYTTTCTGAEPKNGMVASNYWPLGTKIIIDGVQYTVADRGGSSFDNPNRFDVFVERLSGETNQEYRQRVLNMGKKTVEVIIIIQ